MAEISWNTADLLCSENASLCFNDPDSPGEVTQQSNGDFGFGRSEPSIHLPCLSEESFGLMVDRETQQLPKDDYLNRLRNGDSGLDFYRTEALYYILMAHAQWGFGDLTLCVAINYLDRFLSTFDMTNRNWAVQLLSLACLSLAAKMEELYVPMSIDFQMLVKAEGLDMLFDVNSIQKMELIVLNTLGWRMHSYTPCTFIDHFLAKINGDENAPGPFIYGSIQIITNSMKGIDYLEFRPSEIAAAVALFVSGDTTYEAIENIFMAMPCFTKVHKENVVKCLEMIMNFPILNGAASEDSGLSDSVPQSPKGVLEVGCLSFKSDEIAVGSCSNSPQTNSDPKKRRLDN